VCWPLVNKLLQSLKIHQNLTFFTTKKRPVYLQSASVTCTEIKSNDLILGNVWWIYCTWYQSNSSMQKLKVDAIAFAIAGKAEHMSRFPWLVVRRNKQKYLNNERNKISPHFFHTCENKSIDLSHEKTGFVLHLYIIGRK